MTVNYLMDSSDDVNYLMIPSDDGQLPHGFWNFYSWILVMAVNYLMASSGDDGQLPHGF